MLKRVLAIVTLLCVLPVLASAATTSKTASSKQGKSDQITGAAKRIKYHLTATAGAGGMVAPAQRIAFAGPGPAKTFLFKPRPGYGVQAINGTYLENTTFQYLDAVTGQVIALPAPIGVKVRVSITNVNDNSTLFGVFANSTTVAGPNQTVMVGALVTLDGSLSTGFGTYAWTQQSGPTTVTLSGAGTKTATFTAPAAIGTYVFKLTHGDSSATTTVTVTNSLTAAARAECANCHLSRSVGSPNLYTNWSTSIHSRSSHSTCAACHVGADSGAHPGTANANTVDPTTFITKVAGVNGTLPLGAVFCTYCHTGAYPIPHPTTGQTMTCVACHGGGTDAHTIQPATQPPVVNGSTDCSKCHAPENTKFTASKHWVNSVEYSYYNSPTDFGIFYNGPPTLSTPSLSDPSAIAFINPNESWNTYEWNKPGPAPTSPVTCASNCHFESKSASGVSGCNACHSGGLKLGGSFKNGSSAHKALVYSSNTCEYCHYNAKGTGHGLSTAEFHASKHWMNTFEYGPEFQGGAVPNQINPNESWTTTENGAPTTCAYNCHFKPNLGPLGPVKADGTPAKDGRAVLRPGLDGCVACHDPHKPTTTAVATCFECHTGSKHGTTTNGYKASIHFGSEQFHPAEETVYNSTAYKIVKADCLACHNPHKPEQTTPTTSSLIVAAAAATATSPAYNYTKLNPCATCHNGLNRTNSSNPKIISGVVHFASMSTAASNAPSGLSYVGSAGRPVNSCTECHMKYNAHTVANFGNNSASKVLSSWAESGHGSLNADVWKADDHRYKANNDRAGSTKGVTPANSKDNFCVHCHTAKGLVNFVTATTGHPIFTNITSVGDRTNWDASPLVCSGCHSADAAGFTSPAVRVVPAAVGYYNVSTASGNNLTGKISIAHQYPNYGTSNICMTCHVGASGSGEAIKLAFAKSPNFAGSYINPHHGYPGATLANYGLYEYGDYTGLSNSHAAIGGAANGPCVSCHYNGNDHSLAAINAAGIAVNPVCTGCHGASFNVSLAKSSYQSALVVLKNLLVAKGLPIARASANWGTGTTGANNMGASMNYFTLSSDASDSAAYVHNPNYAKKVITDTIDYLAHGSITGNISDVLANSTYTAGLNSGQVARLTFGLGHATGGTGSCATCHAGGLPIGNSVKGCVLCHSIPQNLGAPYVQDNDGVRAVTGEFSKWSHHVTGVTLQDAHCAACHLEGTVVNGSITVNTAYHMADDKTHLRNADTDVDMTWDPAQPNFSTMDNFCLSCHDSNGATSAGSIAIQNVIIPASGKTASPTNPFGDTISNQYDKLERPAVVDAAGQFATGNNAHHAVLGKKYSGRTRTAGPRAVDQSVVAFNSNSSAALPGKRSTIYDAGKFQNDYTTLANADGSENGTLRNGGTTLGDDSTLHCGDCHTVGQYRAADAAPGNRYNKAVIGAHGSNNEYLLRNNVGTDALHQGAETTGGTSAVPTVGYGTKPYLVCFNCHAFQTYGSIGSGTGIVGLNHAGEYANSTRCNGPYNTIFGNMTGEARLRSMVTRTDATGAAGYGKPSGSTFGNMLGIQCANCHNSGVSAGNIFGGIHGSKDQTYTDGMGNTTKHIRFMPGLGNIMYVPGTKGGFTGGTLAAYNSYSGNRNGTGTGSTVGQTYTTLPNRTIVSGTTAANVTTYDGKASPSRPAYSSTATSLKTGSYQYVTGGVSNDLNWEQITQQPVAGQFDYQAKASGCYTLSPPGSVKVVGQNGDKDKLAATDSIEAGLNGPNGTKEVFDNWGGCDDHNGAQGAGTGVFRKVLRKTTY